MPTTTQEPTYQIKASTREWHGTLSQLAHILSRRFNRPEQEVQAALEEHQECMLAQGISAEDADRLREILAYIGVTSNIYREDASQETARAQPRKTQLSWSSRTDSLPSQPVPARPDSKDTRMDPEASLKAERYGSQDKEANPSSEGGWASANLAEIGQLARDIRHPASEGEGWAQAMRPTRTPRPGRQNTFDTDFQTIWDRLSPEQKEPPLHPDDRSSSAGGTQPNPAVHKTSGWEAILGRPKAQEPPQAMDTLNPPEGEPMTVDMDIDFARHTGQWEVIIETDDTSEAFVMTQPQDGSVDELEQSPRHNDLLMHGTTRPEGLTFAHRGSVEEVQRQAPALPDLFAAPTTAPAPLVSALEPARAPLPAMKLPKPAASRPPAGDPTHNATLAALLGLFPGAGQVYNGQWVRAILVAILSPLLFPWLWGMFDAWSTARQIRDGSFSPLHAGKIRHVVLYAVLACGVSLSCTWALRALLSTTEDADALSPEDAEQLSFDRIAARGAAGIHIERAIYRANREREKAEGELTEQSDADADKEAEPQEIRREIMDLLNRGDSACAKGEYVMCRQLAENVLALDASNKKAWGLVVKARQHQPNIQIPGLEPSEETPTEEDDEP